MPNKRSAQKTQTSISLDVEDLAEMRKLIKENNLRGLGHLLEFLWNEKKRKEKIDTDKPTDK